MIATAELVRYRLDFANPRGARVEVFFAQSSQNEQPVSGEKCRGMGPELELLVGIGLVQW